ncbi:hypothetical protein CAEBREN_25160 [Caenorhabditis brenneri]|uniref:LITAF domain-containing protein n=1 Tax=Caenorhabditis brenneri TaxID=135651 RepID=G0NY99_CAEBE|nr:hypothetical protein CAEBREN_25160 [Caenorhabditis brenneri]
MSQRRSNPMLYRLIRRNDGEYDPGHATPPQRADSRKKSRKMKKCESELRILMEIWLSRRRISKTSNFKEGEAIIKKDVEEGKITNEEAHTLYRNHIVSHIERVADVLPWIIFGISAFLGLFLFIIPWCFRCGSFFLEQIFDVNHSCPACKKFLGRFSRV